MQSDKLAMVLQKMLAVGNVMNQGTRQGDAAGFTVDSLLKLINTKGVDRKTTVLDYVVRLIYDSGDRALLAVVGNVSFTCICFGDKLVHRKETNRCLVMAADLHGVEEAERDSQSILIQEMEQLRGQVRSRGARPLVKNALDS